MAGWHCAESLVSLPGRPCVSGFAAPSRSRMRGGRAARCASWPCTAGHRRTRVPRRWWRCTSCARTRAARGLVSLERVLLIATEGPTDPDGYAKATESGPLRPGFRNAPGSPGAVGVRQPLLRHARQARRTCAARLVPPRRARPRPPRRARPRPRRARPRPRRVSPPALRPRRARPRPRRRAPPGRRVSASLADIPVRPNTPPPAMAMAVYSSVLQLVAAVSSITFVLVLLGRRRAAGAGAGGSSPSRSGLAAYLRLGRRSCRVPPGDRCAAICWRPAGAH